MNHKQKMLIKKVKGRNSRSNLFIFLQTIFGAIPMLLIVGIITQLTAGTATREALLLYCTLITLSLVLKSLFYGLSMLSAHNSAYGSLTEVRLSIIEKLRKMPLGFFQTRKTGELAGILNHDVEQIELYLAHGLPEIMSAAVIPVVCAVIIAVIDWRLGLAVACSAPLVMLMKKGFNRFWGQSISKYMESTIRMSSDLMEYVSSIPVIKAFSREEFKTEALLGGMKDYIRWVKNMMFKISAPMGLIAMVLESGLTVMIIVGSGLLVKGEIAIEEFILALILGGLFSSSFAKMATFQHFGIVFNQAMGSVGSILNEEPPAEGSRAQAEAGDILIDNLSFSYPDSKETLSGVSLKFRKNTVNALIGSSGSGKTTLTNLMMGFWKPGSGSISIGGTDISELTEEGLSSLISVVQQEVFLFNLSIEENIRIGKPDATEEEIIEAARKACIHDFIMSLPNQYKTAAGEAGVKLSGGEKQRISIARMILKDAPIFILDEATSAIDSNNEQLIQKAIENLAHDKTIISVAHNLSSIRDADQIVIMDEGRVTETGTHSELMQNSCAYNEMWEKQRLVDSWTIKEAMIND